MANSRSSCRMRYGCGTGIATQPNQRKELLRVTRPVLCTVYSFAFRKLRFIAFRLSYSESKNIEFVTPKCVS